MERADFSNYANKGSYVHKKEVYDGTLECFSYLFSYGYTPCKTYKAIWFEKKMEREPD